MGQSMKYLWAVAGAYLIYLGIQQVIALIRGEASIPWLNACAVVLFIVIGGAVLLREWRAHKKETVRQDPEENDEEESLEGAEEE